MTALVCAPAIDCDSLQDFERSLLPECALEEEEEAEPEEETAPEQPEEEVPASCPPGQIQVQAATDTSGPVCEPFVDCDALQDFERSFFPECAVEEETEPQEEAPPEQPGEEAEPQEESPPEQPEEEVPASCPPGQIQVQAATDTSGPVCEPFVDCDALQDFERSFFPECAPGGTTEAGTVAPEPPSPGASEEEDEPAAEAPCLSLEEALEAAEPDGADFWGNPGAVLDLSVSRLCSDVDLEDLDCFANLRSLALVDTEITSLESFPALPALQSLSVVGAPLTSLEGMPSLLALQRLVISDTAVASLQGMPDLPNLTWLKLARNALTNLEGSPPLLNLETIDLNDSTVTSLDGMPQSPNLHVLD